MEKRDLIYLIENNQIEEFIESVFRNRVVGKGDGFYTMPLSVDEEKALIHRMATDQKNGLWYKALSDYMTHYPLSNAAVEFLLTCIGNAIAVKILCSQFAKYGYTPEQGEKVCRIINNDSNNKIFLPLLPAISKYGRFFDESTYSLLWNIDERLREKNAEKTGYAESYKKNSYSYRMPNILLNPNGYAVCFLPQ